MVPILVVLSSAHEGLYRNYFLPTLPEGFEVRERDMGMNLSDGAYLSGEWQDAMLAKVSHALDFCRQAEEGAVFVVSDVDVQFFQPLTADLFLKDFESLGCNMAFQKERMREGESKVNCGFYAARNCGPVRELLESALDLLRGQEIRNEQSAINAMLAKGIVRHACFDGRYYGRTHGFPPPPGILLHHANWTFNIPQKIRQLDRVRRIVRGGRFRILVETYLEQMERARAKTPGISRMVHAHRQFFARLPVKSLEFP